MFQKDSCKSFNFDRLHIVYNYVGSFMLSHFPKMQKITQLSAHPNKFPLTLVTKKLALKSKSPWVFISTNMVHINTFMRI